MVKDTFNLASTPGDRSSVRSNKRRMKEPFSAPTGHMTVLEVYTCGVTAIFPLYHCRCGPGEKSGEKCDPRRPGSDQHTTSCILMDEYHIFIWNMKAYEDMKMFNYRKDHSLRSDPSWVQRTLSLVRVLPSHVSLQRAVCVSAYKAQMICSSFFWFRHTSSMWQPHSKK